jgi:hypothetical protein
MAFILRFLKTYEVVIYLLMVLIGMAYLRKFYLGLKEWRGTVYGLERAHAQRLLSEAISVLVLLICTGLAIFGLNTFVYPSIPLLQQLATPTLSPLTTPSLTLAASTLQTPGTTAPTSVVVSTQGASISGKVDIKGTVLVDNFGFLKYEYALSGSSSWLTIAANHDILPPDSLFGIWDTSMLAPGDYQLGLVVEDNGKMLPACVISVRILAPSPTP